jgi:hypothetical protein
LVTASMRLFGERSGANALPMCEGPRLVG